MRNYKIEIGFLKLSKALLSLESIAQKPLEKDRSNIDATIQRFEFTVELFWKLLKAILENHGVQVEYPKDILQEAYKGHLIDQEQEWLQMLKDRNLTSHTYDEALADEIFEKIQSYIPMIRKGFDKLNAMIK